MCNKFSEGTVGLFSFRVLYVLVALGYLVGEGIASLVLGLQDKRVVALLC